MAVLCQATEDPGGPKIAARKKLLQSFSARLGTGASVVHSRSAGNLSPREATSITEVPWWQSRSNAGLVDSRPLSREQTSTGRIPWAASRSRACSACALGWSTWRNERRGTESEIFRGQTHEVAGVMKRIDHLDDLDVELNVSGGPPTLEETMSKVKADEEVSSFVPEACALALSTRNRLAGPATVSRPITVASLRARVSSRHSSIEHSGVASLPLDALHDATMSSPSLSRVLTLTPASYIAPSKLSEPATSPEGGGSKRRATSAEVDALQEPEEDEHTGFDFRTVILAASVRKVQRIWRSKIKRSLSNVFKEAPEDDGPEQAVSPTGEKSDLTAEQEQTQGDNTLPEPLPRCSVSTMGGNDLRDTLPCDLDMGWHREESPATDGRLEDGDDAVLQERSVEDNYPAHDDLMDDLVLQERSVGVKVDPAAEELEQLEVAVDLQQSPQHHQETQAQQSPLNESGGKLAETAGEDPLSDRSQSIPSPSHLIQAVCTDKPNVNSSNVSESVRSEGAVSGDDRDSPIEQKNDVAEVEHVEESLGIPGRDRSCASMASDPMERGSHSRDANVSGDYSEEFEGGNEDNKLTFSIAVVDVDENDDENVASNDGPDSPTSPASPASPAAVSEAPSRDCQHLSVSEAVPSMTSASMEQSQSGEDPFLENLAGNRHIHADPFLENLAGNQPIPQRETPAEDVKDDLGDGEYSGEWSGEDSQSLELRELQEDECSGDWSSQGEVSEPDLS